jgi:hypothetical protein
MKPGDKILLIVLVLIVVGSGTMLWKSRQSSGEKTAIISVNGVEVRRINLSKVQEPFTFKVEPKSGEYNVIAVEPGRIRVIEASCPNQIDVRQGWISDSSMSIVCVPNQLVIRIEEQNPSNGIDGTAY